MKYVYSRILLFLFVTNFVRTYAEPTQSNQLEITTENESNVGWACFINVEGKYCSGVIITTYFVISSRRCYYEHSEFKSSIYLGGRSYKSFSDLYSPGVQSFRILRLITSDALGEIMLVQSETPFKFSQNINRVSITAGAQLENSKNSSCLFAGFGTRPQYDMVAQLTTQEFQVFTGDDCGAEGSQPFIKKSSMICTKPSVGDNVGFCPGDYGGGLVCDNVLVGVAHASVYVLKNETLCTNRVKVNLFAYVGPLANLIDMEVQKHTRAVLKSPFVGQRLVSRSGADKWLPKMIISLATHFVCLFTIS